MADDSSAGGSSQRRAESPGATLRRAREKAKLTTRDVANKLNVDTWILEAIERDEFAALGAPVFAKGHLRKYATELEVDPDDLMVGYYEVSGPRETPPLIAESILRMEAASGPSFAWLLPGAIVVAAIATVAAAALWYLRSDAVPRPASAAAVTVPVQNVEDGQRSATLSLPTAGDASNDAQEAPAEDTVEPVAQQLAAVDAQPEPEAPPEPAPAAGAAAAPAVATRTAPPPADERVTIMLRFRDDSWVEVYDRDRTKLLYGIGEADTVQYLSGPPPLAVFLGRYRSVDVEVNGSPFEIPRAARRTNTARFNVVDPAAN